MSSAKPGYQRDFLTPAGSFYEITRGKPYLLDNEARMKAGLTPETWRLEVVPDEPPWRPTLARTLRKDDGTALTLGDLEALFRERPVRCVKTMQCLMDSPSSGLCSNGLWEGVALRDVIARLGRLKDVRRVFYTGFFQDPKHRFASSLSLSEVLETPPGHTPISSPTGSTGAPCRSKRGGPVRMMVPVGHGFKSIKWLQPDRPDQRLPGQRHLRRAAEQRPRFVPMKTWPAWTSRPAELPTRRAGRRSRGVAMVGWSGLQRVEYWLRQGPGQARRLTDDDPAWATAEWKQAALPGGPPNGWASTLPEGRFPEGVPRLRPDDGEAAGVAAAVQLGGVGGEAGRAGGRAATSSGPARSTSTGSPSRSPGRTRSRASPNRRA